MHVFSWQACREKIPVGVECAILTWNGFFCLATRLMGFASLASLVRLASSSRGWTWEATEATWATWASTRTTPSTRPPNVVQTDTMPFPKRHAVGSRVRFSLPHSVLDCWTGSAMPADRYIWLFGFGQGRLDQYMMRAAYGGAAYFFFSVGISKQWALILPKKNKKKTNKYSGLFVLRDPFRSPVPESLIAVPRDLRWKPAGPRLGKGKMGM